MIGYMKLKHRFLEYAYWKRDDTNDYFGSGFWFRIFGYGLWFSNGALNFSERNGYKKIRKLPFGWRMGFLKRGNSG